MIKLKSLLMIKVIGQLHPMLLLQTQKDLLEMLLKTKQQETHNIQFSMLKD